MTQAWDAMVDHLQEVKSRPVWTEMTPEVRFKFATETSPTAPQVSGRLSCKISIEHSSVPNIYRCTSCGVNAVHCFGVLGI